MTGIEDYLFDRRESFITRWHAEPHIRNESLAEHNYFVTRNALMLCRALQHYEIAIPNIEAIVTMAVVHDELEKETGDISGKAKREYPELKSAIKGIEFDILYENKLYNNVPTDIANKYTSQAIRLFLKEINDLETQVISYTDILEAHIYAKTELSFGNLNMSVVIERTLEWMQELTWPWLQELRKHINIP
jgi:5'-deoxynucleotidase